MMMVGNIVIASIAVLHIYIMVIEIFLWDKPMGLRAFGFEKTFATKTKVLAANQGLYNGFLAAGLILGLVVSQSYIKLFFLICIFVAGIFGGLTFNKKTVFIQSIPSLIAMMLLLLV